VQVEILVIKITLEFQIKEKTEIKDFRKEIIENYLDKNFKGNENFKKIVETSAFCSEDNNIIKMIIIKFQKIKKLELYLQ
jgi:hypothetical protein